MLEHAHTIATIALGAFSLSVIGSWCVGSRRWGGASLEGSPGANPGSDPARVPGQPGTSPRDGGGVFRQHWGRHAHAVEFVRWMRDWGFAGRRFAAAQVVDYYAWFCADLKVEPLGVAEFLEALGALHGSVRKKRDRIKCPKTGKVLKLASGTPARTRYYTILEAGETRVPTGVRAPSTSPKARASSGKPRIELRRRRATAEERAVASSDEICAGMGIAA